MKSASNGDVLNGSLQVLHVHVLLVALLGAGHMAQPGTNQHKGSVAVRETAHHTGAAADLPVQSLNHIIGADTGPVLTGKITVGKSLFYPILYLLGGASFSFMERSSSTTALAFSLAALLLS